MKILFLLLAGVLSSGMLSAQTLSIFCEDNKPIQYLGADGKPAGFAVDVVREIQRRTDSADEIQLVPWARGLNRLNANPNTLLFSMARTAERDNLYQWIGPIFDNSYAFYIRADSTLSISNLEDAKKLSSIGVYRGDVRDQVLTNLGFANLDRANSNLSNVKKLMAGRIAMFAGSPTNMQALAEEAGYKLSDFRLVFVFMHKQLYIAASLGTDPSLVAKWSAALEQMKRDKTFEKMFKQYFPGMDLPSPVGSSF
ncbi:MAG: transporter substrate-binding domain-containing protein [Pseudomonadota bacterium]